MSYLSDIYEIINEKDRIITENMEDKYLSDALGRVKGTADVVIFPVSSKEVSEIMKIAWKNEVAVTPRGAGTNLVGSTVPDKGGIVLDFSLMNQILELDEETFTVTMESGVTLQDLQQYVENKGYFYPPDPGEKTATIGGNISTNAGGMRAVKYGVTRDYVMGLELVLADGRVMQVGSKNRKDASGLSLKNSIVGSEGTLAIITKCILKIIPKPEKSISVLLPFCNIETAVKSVFPILKSNIEPTAIEFIEREVIHKGEQYLGLEFPYKNAGAYILLTFDGSESVIHENLEQIKQIAQDHNALETLVLDDAKTAENVWKIRGCLVKAVEAKSEQEPVDLVVPINKIYEFIQFVCRYEQENGIKIVRFGHAGDGNIHLCILREHLSESEWKVKLHQTMLDIYEKAYSLGGLTSGEHGIGLGKKAYYLKNAPDINLEIMRGIKSAFDKKDILNSRKAYS